MENQESNVKKTSGLAIAGFVLSIFAILFSFIPIINTLALIFAILGLIFGIIALIQKSKKGMAIACVVLSILAIIITCVIKNGTINALNNVGKSINEATNETNESVNKVLNTVENTTTPKVVTGNINEEIVQDDTSLTVTNVTKSNGSIYSKPASGKEYVIVSVTIKNNGKQNLAYNPYYFKMQNGNGAQEKITFFADNQDTELDTGELAPGGTVSGTLAFEEIPGDALTLILETDMFNGNTINVKIQ